MTVQNTNTKNIYVGNGSTTVFPFTFYAIQDKPEYIKVYITSTDGVDVLTDNYTIDMDAQNVTYPKNGSPLKQGEKITIARELPFLQDLNLVNQGPFFAEEIEKAFDRDVMLLQQIYERIGRALAMGISVDVNKFNPVIPLVPGMSFRVNDAGTALESTEDPARVLPLAEGIYQDTVAIKNQTATIKSETELVKAETEVIKTEVGEIKDLAQAWAEGEGSPDGQEGSRSAKGWAEYIEESLSENTSLSTAKAIGRLANTTYSVGNVVYTDSNLSVALKCTTAGTTSNTELDISTRAVGESVEDGTCVWKLVSRVSDGMPVGFKYFDWVKEIPVGALGALGALYNRELYADLWKSAQENKQVITEAEWQALAQANDGNVPWYSDGDGSTTFRVPALKCWFKGASGIEEVGNYLEAGLPNIEGEFNIGSSNGVATSSRLVGAFAKGASCTANYQGAGSNGFGVNFAASRSNPIYGNSDTVQPPSLIGIWLIKAYGTVTNVGNADVANVMQVVEQVQTQVGAIEQGVGTAIDYIVESYRNGTEWYEVYKSGKVRQGGWISTVSTSKTVTLLHSMRDGNYSGYATLDDIDTLDRITAISGKTTSSFVIRVRNCDNSDASGDIGWAIEG